MCLRRTVEECPRIDALNFNDAGFAPPDILDRMYSESAVADEPRFDSLSSHQSSLWLSAPRVLHGDTRHDGKWRRLRWWSKATPRSPPRRRTSPESATLQIVGAERLAACGQSPMGYSPDR